MNGDLNERAGHSVLAGLLLLFTGMPFIGDGMRRNGPKREEEKNPVIREKKEGKTEEGKRGWSFLPRENLKNAGIKVQRTRKEAVSAPLSATAAIEFNGDRMTRVSSRVARQIRGIRASQGDRVEARQVLVYLDTAELDTSMGGIYQGQREARACPQESETGRNAL